MRVGLAQLNTTVGDLAGNRRLIIDAYAALVAQGAELVIFPELIVCGYPPRDLLFKRQFVPDVEESLRSIAAAVGEVPALIGTVETNVSGRPAVLQRRRLLPPRRSPPPRASASCRPTTSSTRTATSSRRPSPRSIVPRRPAHRRHDLRGHLDPSDDQHPPALSRADPVKQLATNAAT
jgi:hypothetical protein